MAGERIFPDTTPTLNIGAALSVEFTESELDSQFEKEIREFKTKRLPQIYLLLDKYSGEKSVTVLRSREEADEYVESIKITRLQI